jgi:membrane-bound lytic murein transglycosylase D
MTMSLKPASILVRPRSLVLHAAAGLMALWLAGCASSPPVTPPAAETPTTTVEIPAPPTVEPSPPPAAAPVEAPIVLKPLLQRNRALLDPLDDSARGDLWARVRLGFSAPDIDGDLVRKWEHYYSTRPEYVQRMTVRGARYLFHIVEEIDRRQMPTELALLPFVESAFDPQALSVARAAGMWQFMPGTGRDFELKQNLFRDDRRDILASTRAALDYLQALHNMFGDWHLALAAYNWGQGNVQKAIARNRKLGLPTDYASLRMPDETRNYVPKLQAVKNIVARPEVFSIVLPPLEDHPYFISVPIERDIDVELAAQFSGLTIEQFQQLNPQMNKPVILAAGHTSGPAPVRQRQPVSAPAGTSSWTAGDVDSLGRPTNSLGRRGGTPGRHDRGPHAGSQSHSGAHARQGWLDPARAARRACHGRCGRARG